ncbi:MAG: site-specific DNA-methyltransferase [Coriobacteriales bacterium]|jgi:site-specific DNA-methyltransferase (adenine-specific)|nr:site-specific DNA-methyltransferase [Coriobacteriales bacterium]
MTDSSQTLFLSNEDTLNLYSEWPSPTVIISDGPYGISGFKGDLCTNIGLGEWYEPHIEAWASRSTPVTTLWFWNTELGWATVHPTLEKYGWEFKACHTWDKGMSHVAGNTNTRTIRHLPVVTEVCVQYVLKPIFEVDEEEMSMKEWLRYEWGRSGLPFSKTNDACGVANAATRKYFTKCHLWYMPPVDAFTKLSEYANTYGDPSGRPYFSIDGENPISADSWGRMRSKFKCPMGITNVWSLSQLRNDERLKNSLKAIHLNQKPIELLSRIIEMTSDEGDIVWDPFGGLFSTAIASLRTNRICYSSEINRDVYRVAVARVENELKQGRQCVHEYAV